MEQGEASDLLRRAGLRVTAPRTAVLAELARTPHSDAETLRRRVAQRLGGVSAQTIYDVLHALEGAAIVRRIDPAGGRARFELEPGDRHQHLVCRRCGAMVDVTPIADELLQPPPDTRGFLVERTEVQYLGLCPACRQPPLSTNHDPRPTTHE